MNTTQTVYITTSIPYVNAPPHIGHALELVQADALARSNRLLGNQVVLQTGTDENASKNVAAAEDMGISTQELVDRNSELFRDLVHAIDFSAHTFVRTTDARHWAGVSELWRRLDPHDLYWGEYEGLYCRGCEDFLSSAQLVDGQCPDHLQEPERTKERNLFFRLSRYERELEQLLSSDRLAIQPAGRKEEILNFVRSGLRDISVSRPAERVSGWGIPVPGEEDQIIYVWIDALINYLSGLGFGRGETWARTWNGTSHKTHVVGKNVWKFHAVYWPALLLSAKLDLPDRICVHGFLTVDGKKISKSIGNTVDPIECISDYGSDAVRLLLLSYPPHADGDYTVERLSEVYTSYLANGVGNLASRVTALAERFGHSRTALSPEPLGRPSTDVLAAVVDFRFGDAVELVRGHIDGLNRRIDSEQVWREADAQKAEQRVCGYVKELREIAEGLQVMVPNGAARILAHLQRVPLRKLAPLYPTRRP